MAVIKQQLAERFTQSAVVLDLGDLKRQGAAILARAKMEAQKRLDAAEEEANRLIASAAEIGEKRGYEDGLQRGLTAGREQGCTEARAAHARELQELIARWTQSIDAWDAARRDMLLEAKSDVIALAIELAARLTHRQIVADPSLIADQVGEALTLVSRRSHAVVRIHPDDRPLLEGVFADIVARVDTCAEARLVEDERITRGGCTVSTDGGLIDATIETQLDRLAEALLPGRARSIGSPDDPDNEVDGAAL